MACKLIGGGRPLTKLDQVIVRFPFSSLFPQLRPATIHMLSVSDTAFIPVLNELHHYGHKIFRPRDIIFHVSGTLSSHSLGALRNAYGVSVASIHPVRSFTPLSLGAQHDTTSLSSSTEAALASSSVSLGEHMPFFCGVEGDQHALDFMKPLFAAVGGEFFTIGSGDKQKVLYHLGAVLASNYLITLLDMALAAYAAAGISRLQAHRVLLPIVAETLRHAQQCPPDELHRVLTGPLARGDAQTVRKHIDALRSRELTPQTATTPIAEVMSEELYRLMAQRTQVLLPDQHPGKVLTF